MLNFHFVLQVKAIDNDFGQYASVYYEIASEEMKKYFEINRNTGLITSKVAFDREIKDEYVLQLKAIDGGSKFGFATLRVSIEDVNDNSPQFFLKEYKIVKGSSIKPNDTILTVSINMFTLKESLNDSTATTFYNLISL